MQNNNDNYQFKPRGIEKWHAFSAVVSEEEQINSIGVENIDLDYEYVNEEDLFDDFLE